MEAIVKWFNNEKGYGFVKYKKGEDIFIHYSAINIDGYKTLKEGDIVEFELINTKKGYQAKDIVLKVKENYIEEEKKSKVELVAAVATIAGFALQLTNINKTDTNKTVINCNNCEIKVIENYNNDDDVIIEKINS